MRRRSTTPRPLLGWITLGLVTVLAGCVANAGSLGSGASQGPVSTQAALAIPTSTPDPTPDPTPQPTLPWTGAMPTATPAPPSLTPTPAPTPQYDPPPKRGPFAMNLYHRGDF